MVLWSYGHKWLIWFRGSWLVNGPVRWLNHRSFFFNHTDASHLSGSLLFFSLCLWTQGDDNDLFCCTLLFSYLPLASKILQTLRKRLGKKLGNKVLEGIARFIVWCKEIVHFPPLSFSLKYANPLKYLTAYALLVCVVFACLISRCFKVMYINIYSCLYGLSLLLPSKVWVHLILFQHSNTIAGGVGNIPQSHWLTRNAIVIIHGVGARCEWLSQRQQSTSHLSLYGDRTLVQGTK